MEAGFQVRINPINSAEEKSAVFKCLVSYLMSTKGDCGALAEVDTLLNAILVYSLTQQMQHVGLKALGFLDGVMQVMEWAMCLIAFASEWFITYSWVLNTNDLIDLTCSSMHKDAKINDKSVSML